jgi:hypothetical protein
VFNLAKISAVTPDNAAREVRDALDDTEDTLRNQQNAENAASTNDIENSIGPEERATLDQYRISNLVKSIQQILSDDKYRTISAAVYARPEIQSLIEYQNPTVLLDKIKSMGLEGAAATLDARSNALVQPQLLKAYFDRMARILERQNRNLPPGTMTGSPTVQGLPARAFNAKEIRRGQVEAPDPVNELDKGMFITKYLPILIAYNANDANSQESILSNEAKKEILRKVSRGLENDANDAIEAVQQMDPINDAEKARNRLEILYEVFIAPAAFDPSNTMEPVMSTKNPKGIIAFNLSEYILNNKAETRETMVKTAADQFGQQYLLYGPTEKRVCPKLRGKGGGQPGSGDVVSEYVCRHHCLDGIVIDDNKTICGEALWRANVMDKYSREYVDKDGNIVGGYLNKRFEINRNVPEENKMRLKPGEIRKPRPPEMGNLESRMQAMRAAEGKKRGYRPDTNTGDPFRWDTDVDQNNVEQTQAERDRREEASGHKTVQYTDKNKIENNPKKAFNLKSVKTAQTFEDIKYDFTSGQEKARQMSTEELHFALKDLREVIKIQEDARRAGHHVPKLGYYWDELHTYAQELKNRQNANKSKQPLVERTPEQDEFESMFEPESKSKSKSMPTDVVPGSGEKPKPMPYGGEPYTDEEMGLDQYTKDPFGYELWECPRCGNTISEKDTNKHGKIFDEEIDLHKSNCGDYEGPINEQDRFNLRPDLYEQHESSNKTPVKTSFNLKEAKSTKMDKLLNIKKKI